MKIINRKNGFSLIEVSIVLTIVALLLAGLIPTLSSQIDQRRRYDTEKYMAEVRDALLGYAVINNVLPCPDKDNDGNAEVTCHQGANTNQFGTLPYKNLGVPAKDTYGNPLIYAVTKAFANSGVTITLSVEGAMDVCKTSACVVADKLATKAVVVLVSRGANWASVPSADELENTDSSTSGDYNFVSHDSTPDFDDPVMWLSSNTLLNRLIAAGKLP